MSSKRYVCTAPGDVNAFFGLMLDDVADLILTVGLLAGVFGFPADFVLRYMVPGTAIGVFVGDLLLLALAFRWARRTGRNNIAAMSLGLDMPCTFGMVFPFWVALNEASPSYDGPGGCRLHMENGNLRNIQQPIVQLCLSTGQQLGPRNGSTSWVAGQPERRRARSD